MENEKNEKKEVFRIVIPRWAWVTTAVVVTTAATAAAAWYIFGGSSE